MKRKSGLAALLFLAFFLAQISECAPADDMGGRGGDRRMDADLSGAGWSMWYDADAKWKDDELFLPPADLSKLPGNAPSCGWERLDQQAKIEVSVPGTVEEYLPPAPRRGCLGVSWWWRSIRIPEIAAGSRGVLKFGAVRERAEIYLDQQLVGYDIVGSTPFEVDLTPHVKPGQVCQLAVRVTNPGGVFTFDDTLGVQWGKYKLPGSHGFGGIIEPVRLEVTAPVFIRDLYVENTADPRLVSAIIELTNSTGQPANRDLSVSVFEKGGAVPVFQTSIPGIQIAAGETAVKTVKISVPSARLWDLETPNLYDCRADLSGGGNADGIRRAFGFRSFELDHAGSNAVLRLNGRRIVLCTAISWGFWPVNGIFPTPELAEQQIRTAKNYGMNMLNFHRCIGSPVVLDKADELGLLYFGEPGGYVGAGNDSFGQAVAREKLLRMVKRDRSHPSLVIYNMINEQWDKYGADKDEKLFSVHLGDLRQAHAADPSRLITYASAWAKQADADEKAKMHMRPFDGEIHMRGWFDNHRALGPATWQETIYQGPAEHYGYTANSREVVYWGEEAAMSSPSPLGTIRKILDASPRKGFDGDTWLKWHDRVAEFLKEKDLQKQYPDVDSFCKALGAVSLEHQGRKIELTRICDNNDGYSINGWEDTIDDNHSAVVDCWRNPKADPDIIARHNRPLLVSVQSRNLVVETESMFTVDFHAVNEVNLQGPHILKIRAMDAAGAEVFEQELPVELKGGDVFGQLLAEAVQIPSTGKPGLHRIEAELTDPAGAVKTSGYEDVLCIDWKSAKLTGRGAVYEWGSAIRDFLKTGMSLDAPLYDGTQGKLDWLIVACPPLAQPTTVPPEFFCDAEGQPAGVKTTFFKGADFKTVVAVRTQHNVDFKNDHGATPDPELGTDRNYSIRWEGWLLPRGTGIHAFNLQIGECTRGKLFLNNKVVLDLNNCPSGTTQLKLQAGRPVKVRVDFQNPESAAGVQLEWSAPGDDAPDPKQIVDRARNDGTTVIVVDCTENWMPCLVASGLVEYNGKLPVNINWVGGQYFVREGNPLFKDLPDGVMSWPYESVIQPGRNRYGLRIRGENLAAGCWQSKPFELATAVGVVPCGNGRIVVSTLDIVSNLSRNEGPAATARKLLCNYIEYANRKD